MLEWQWHITHKTGDLVRVNDRCDLISTCTGDLGIIIEEPNTSQINLFIKVYILRQKEIVLLTPREIDIISNID